MREAGCDAPKDLTQRVGYNKCFPKRLSRSRSLSWSLCLSLCLCLFVHHRRARRVKLTTHGREISTWPNAPATRNLLPFVTGGMQQRRSRKTVLRACEERNPPLPRSSRTKGQVKPALASSSSVIAGSQHVPDTDMHHDRQKRSRCCDVSPRLRSWNKDGNNLCT